MLLVSRAIYENMLYDYLLAEPINAPDNFWDPVKIILPESDKLKLIQKSVQAECIICCSEKTNFLEMGCCKQKFCEECTDFWFNESVKCPFCKHDLRDPV